MTIIKKSEYLKPYNYVQIICIRQEYLIYNCVPLYKRYKCTMNIIL